MRIITGLSVETVNRVPMQTEFFTIVEIS